MSIGATIHEKTAGLQEYIKKMAPTGDLQSERLRQLKPSTEEEPKGTSWTDKPLHGMCHHQIEKVADIRKSIPMAGKSWTEEALIMAAQ